ncbi:class I SAM-dependent methyltransferase [Paraliomyxa miuraensis]|uniref:class I SAM-dependent methyltransferase n=1 Tax=Paraliomyxa miuraensis TaxID=376150 RepID=UPI002254DA45|nr:class I SAM-dependent methyltransferase [Paraliomyxa miuraensis]MCX4244481.1 class I SAM-dependent methyltransferase [Paraliomyxa miuraensis]
MSKDYGNKQKHESRNPIQRALIHHFKSRAIRLVQGVAPRSILEVGCGEGYMLDALSRGGVTAALHGVDFSEPAIEDARTRLGARAELEARDARELADDGRTFDLVMMLEVLEHIPDPAQMLPILDRLTRRHLLLSVPWEPMFRGLNMARGKHVRAFGNDPEHVNHWSRRGFFRFIEPHFEILEAPLVAPWTMVLAQRRGS